MDQTASSPQCDIAEALGDLSLYITPEVLGPTFETLLRTIVSENNSEINSNLKSIYDKIVEGLTAIGERSTSIGEGSTSIGEGSTSIGEGSTSQLISEASALVRQTTALMHLAFDLVKQHHEPTTNHNGNNLFLVQGDPGKYGLIVGRNRQALNELMAKHSVHITAPSSSWPYFEIDCGSRHYKSNGWAAAKEICDKLRSSGENFSRYNPEANGYQC